MGCGVAFDWYLAYYVDADDEPVPWLYLTDASDSGMRVLRYFVLNKCMLNVDSDAAGIAYWLDWMGAIVEIALFEGTYCGSFLRFVFSKPFECFVCVPHLHAADQLYDLCRA